MDSNLEVNSYLSEICIPGGNGALSLRSPCPRLFEVISGVSDVPGTSTGGGKPKIVVASGNEKKLVLFVDDPKCGLDICYVFVEKNLMDVFIGKKYIEKANFVATEEISKAALLDIVGDPFLYIKKCGLTGKEIEEEVARTFGCELFQTPHIGRMRTEEMARLANELKRQVRASPNVDWKQIRWPVMAEYIASLPRGAMMGLLGDMMSYIKNE